MGGVDREDPVRFCHKRVGGCDQRGLDDINGRHSRGRADAIADVIGEGVGADETSIGHIGQAAVERNVQAAVRWGGETCGGDSGLPHTRIIVGEQPIGGVDRQRRTRVVMENVGVRDDSGADFQCHNRARGQRTIADVIGEAVCADIVRRGRIGEAAIERDAEGAVSRRRKARRDDGVVVGIEIIGEKALGGAHRQRAIFGDAVVIRSGDRGLSHDINGRDGGSGLCAVADVIREGICADEPSVGHIGQATVERNVQAAVGRG